MPIHTIDDYLRIVERRFSPEHARGAHAVLFYRFTGRESGECYARVEDGVLTVARGVPADPTVTVEVDFDLWARIVSYEVDGLMAYQEGQYKVTGDIEALIDSDGWFPR